MDVPTGEFQENVNMHDRSCAITLSVIIPALNEEAGIAELFSKFCNK